MVYTVVAAIKDGKLSIIGILEGPHGLRSASDVPDDVEFFTDIFTADNAEAAEALARDKYEPKPMNGAAELEPPC